LKPRAGLAAVKAWPGNTEARGTCVATASLDDGCARRGQCIAVGTKKPPGRTKKLTEELAAMP
jgi:hypothetical protein